MRALNFVERLLPRGGGAVLGGRDLRGMVMQLAVLLTLVLGAVSAVHAVRGPAPDFATRYAGGVVTGRGQNPYDSSAINPVERTLVGYRLAYPFNDPPPVAWAFRAVALIPYGPAKLVWFAFILVCSVVCVACTARIVGWTLQGWSLLLAALVVSIAFGPLREGLVLLQLDPLVGALALAAFLYARRGGAGLLYALATLKPQGIILGAVGGGIRGGARFVAWLVAGWAVLVGGTVLAGRPTWPGWIRQASNSSGTHGALKITLVAAGAVIVLTGSLFVWRRVSRSLDPGLAAFAVGACVTSILGQQFHLNPQSRLLMLVPFALLLDRGAEARRESILLGAAMGIYAVDGLFAVSYHSGISHAVTPLLVAVSVAVAVVVRYPRLATVAWVALGVNVVLTVPPLSPTVHVWMGAFGALLALGLLAHGSQTDARRI